jgi:hypothetical protein
MNCQEIRPLLQSYIDNELTKPMHQQCDNHLRGCPDCRHELTERRELTQRVRMAFAYRAQMALATLGPVPAVLPPAYYPRRHWFISFINKLREDKKVRRLAYLTMGCLAVIICVLSLLPGRSEKINGAAVLQDTLKSLREAPNLHVVMYSGEYGSRGSVSFANMYSKPIEMWHTATSCYSLNGDVSADPFVGKSVITAYDTKTRTAWAYQADKKTINTAKLNDAAIRVADTLLKSKRTIELYVVTPQAWQALPADAKTITEKKQQGRYILELTASQPQPYEFVIQTVMDIDAKTHHLINLRRYVSDTNMPKQLFNKVDLVDYNAAPPSALVKQQAPADIARQPAGIQYEDDQNSSSLWLLTGGGMFGRLYLGGASKETAAPSGPGTGGMMGPGTGGTQAPKGGAGMGMGGMMKPGAGKATFGMSQPGGGSTGGAMMGGATPPKADPNSDK